jgi:S1-C subfamily serine protease
MKRRILQGSVCTAVVAWMVVLGAVASGQVPTALAAASEPVDKFIIRPAVAWAGEPLRVLRQVQGEPGAVMAQAGEVKEETGILVAGVLTDSPADKAGIKRGDILLKVGGSETNDVRVLHETLGNHTAGDQIEVVVRHGDDERTLTVTLDENKGNAFMGIIPCDDHAKMVVAHFAAPSAMIREVADNSPASQAGLTRGDAIVAVDGQKLDEAHTLADVMAVHKPGDTITLEVHRPGEKSREVQVTLGEHPETAGKAYLGISYLSAPAFGMRAERAKDFLMTTPDLEALGADIVERGASVQQVKNDSPAASAGLQSGDLITAIDGIAVETPLSLSAAVGAHKPGDTLTLTVQRKGEEQPREMTVTLGENPNKAGAAYLGVEAAFMMRIERQGDGTEESIMRFELPAPGLEDGELHSIPFSHFEAGELPSIEALPEQFEFRVAPPAGAPADHLIERQQSA